MHELQEAEFPHAVPSAASQAPDWLQGRKPPYPSNTAFDDLSWNKDLVLAVPLTPSVVSG